MKLGRYGENKAVMYLENMGYRILEQNYRYQRAEIDLIARKGDTLAIIEVKTRSGTTLERKVEAVNRRKIDRLVMAADHYMSSKQWALEVRFDIIWITRQNNGITLEHLQNAFYHF